MKLVETIVAKGKIVESNPSKLPKGVLCRGVWPICNIGELNHNNRVYEKAVWERVNSDNVIIEKMKNRTLFGQAEHPKETQSDLQLTSHIITNKFFETVNENGKTVEKAFDNIDVLDTPCGRIINTLLEAGCMVGVSTRAEGDLEEAEKDGQKFQRVIPESFRYVTTDFTADPSTLGTIPMNVEKNLVREIKEAATHRGITRVFATNLLGTMKDDEAKQLKECIEGSKVCECHSEFLCSHCEHCEKKKIEEKSAYNLYGVVWQEKYNKYGQKTRKDRKEFIYKDARDAFIEQVKQRPDFIKIIKVIDPVEESKVNEGSVTDSFEKWKETNYKELKHDYDRYVEKSKFNNVVPGSFDWWLGQQYASIAESKVETIEQLINRECVNAGLGVVLRERNGKYKGTIKSIKENAVIVSVKDGEKTRDVKVDSGASCAQIEANGKVTIWLDGKKPSFEELASPEDNVEKEQEELKKAVDNLNAGETKEELKDNIPEDKEEKKEVAVESILCDKCNTVMLKSELKEGKCPHCVGEKIDESKKINERTTWKDLGWDIDYSEGQPWPKLTGYKVKNIKSGELFDIKSVNDKTVTLDNGNELYIGDDFVYKKRYTLVKDGKDVEINKKKSNESKQPISFTAKSFKQLKIKEASIRAERDKAIELLENNSIQLDNMSSKLNEAKIEIDSLCKVIENKALSVKKIEETRKDLDSKISNLENSIKEQKTLNENKLNEQRIQLEKDKQKSVVEAYVGFKICNSGITLSQNSKALLESCVSTVEVDKVFEQIREALRRDALRPESPGNIKVINERKEDPGYTKIKDSVSNAFSGM